MKMNDGFLLVATHIKSYLTAAQMLCESIKDYHPKADVALYTEDRWLEDPANDVFDHVQSSLQYIVYTTDRNHDWFEVSRRQ